MDYVEQWQKMREESKRRAEQKDIVLIHIFNNKYGFKININHPLVAPKWEAFKKKKKLSRWDMTDALRREFEETFMKSRYYQKCIEQERQKYGPAYEYINFKAS